MIKSLCFFPALILNVQSFAASDFYKDKCQQLTKESANYKCRETVSRELERMNMGTYASPSPDVSTDRCAGLGTPEMYNEAASAAEAGVPGKGDLTNPKVTFLHKKTERTILFHPEGKPSWGSSGKKLPPSYDVEMRSAANFIPGADRTKKNFVNYQVNLDPKSCNITEIKILSEPEAGKVITSKTCANTIAKEDWMTEFICHKWYIDEFNKSASSSKSAKPATKASGGK